MGTKMKKKEDKTPGLIDWVFSWSLPDIMNTDLYKFKINQIPETFSSRNHYLGSFIYPLLEETRADLLSNMSSLSRAPSCEVSDVKRITKTHDILSYKLLLKAGAYKPEFGDLIALTEVKPKRIDDLDRPKRSYLIALVQDNKSLMNIQILSSKPISSVKENKEKGVPGDKLFAVYLTNMITNTRIWSVLHPDIKGGNMRIINSVLGTNPSVEEQCSICSTNGSKIINLSKSRNAISCFGLDDSQIGAVLDCIALYDCHHQHKVKLIWGPPGTGKTKTVASLLFAIFKMKHRTLTCAPTNAAVIGVIKRTMSLLSGTLIHGTYGLGDIVLFGNGERMMIKDHEDLFDVFLNHRVDVLNYCFAPFTGWNASLEYMICLLEDPESHYLRYLSEEKVEKRDESDVDIEVVVRNEENGNSLKDKSKGMEKKKFWKELIIRDLNESKKKNEETRTKDKGKGNNDEKKIDNGDIQRTFEEFFTKTFTDTKEQLMICMKGLYTHMPTSYVPMKVLKKMIRVLEILDTLQILLNKFDVSNGGLREVLKGNRLSLDCVEILKLLRGVISAPKGLINNFCLKNSCLIFCTASGSFKLYTKGMTPIEMVIIDEAAQLKECESCIPLQLEGVRHAVLVGDEKQLPAMVQSKVCEKAEFGRSLFERLVILGHSKHLLSVQYRMHPSISLFPNREFYGKKIRNGRNVTLRSYERHFMEGKMFGSYSFIDINNGKEEFDDRHSRKNMVEVAVIADILSKLHEESVRSKQKVRVGCISPYKAQVHATQERLGSTYSTDVEDKFSVNVRSVDGFQGGEEDVIIISTVRCNEKGSIGFLDNFQRVNVALTRARYCLWILGNSATLLKSGTVWKKIVLDTKSRGCFYNAHEDEKLSLAINESLVELGQLNALFTTDSILFRTSKWKVYFSAQFQESMIKYKLSGFHKDIIAKLVKLSNGFREEVKDKRVGKTGGASSQLLEFYDVKETLKLIWTIEILRENSIDLQVIKVWDILPGIEIPKLVKALDVLFGNYTMNYRSRCLCKQIDGNLTIPMTWPDTSDELTRKLAAVSLGDAPGSSRIRKDGKKHFRSRRRSRKN